MASTNSLSQEWHEGEQLMHLLLHVPEGENPTMPGLSSYGSHLLEKSPLLALGTVDDRGQHWTTVLGGEPGFARQLGHSIIGIKTLVDRKYDPVINILLGNVAADGEAHNKGEAGRIVGGLAIILETRNRIKLAGRMVASALGHVGTDKVEDESGVAEVQLVIKIEQSLGNCPKYLNKKQIVATLPEPRLVSDSVLLPLEAVQLLAKADLFFISSSHDEDYMGTNHRGGPPGFTRVMQNDHSGHAAIAFPEYSGNRLYQTLGNLQTTPQAGLVFPDFDTGDVLYVTGTTEIVIGKEAASILPRSNLVVKVNVARARFVRQGLPFRALSGDPSPYNPPVRYLATENKQPDAQNNSDRTVYAKMLARDTLTSSIARFRFSISDPEAAGRWTPGQYVTLAFEDELGQGYSHMREDDPKSLNDDYVRTFTVSSPPDHGLPHDEFEVTIRNVGTVTNFLFKLNMRASLEVPLKGFGGIFAIDQRAGDEKPTGFVAGAIGITPLLAQLPELNIARLRLFWAINLRDMGLVVDTFERCPSLGAVTNLFIAGADEKAIRTIEGRLKPYKVDFCPRRMLASDIEEYKNTLGLKWYICAGTALRKSLLGWLKDREVVYEDFDY